MTYPKLTSLRAYLHRLNALKTEAIRQSDEAWANVVQRAITAVETDVGRLHSPLGGLIQAQKVNAARQAARAQRAEAETRHALRQAHEAQAVQSAARAQQTQAAETLRFLRGLPAPAGCSPRLYAGFLRPNLSTVAAVAQEYARDGQRQGVPWETLLQTGFEGAARHLCRHAAQPTAAGPHFTHAIRQSLAALVLRVPLQPGELLHLTDKSSFWPTP